ncbi:MAG: methyltransferase domain-containing protein [Deltaproteobacteria bacterium]|nr:methyltransferase domain-containing protein [Deltaproteobacteria bacterium]
MVPGQAPLVLEMAHRNRYKFAGEFCRNKKVLDFGCGAGYGSHMLSAVSANVLGVDISQEAVQYAQKHYRASNLQYKKGEMGSLLSGAERFDEVICFEVIEHLEEPQIFLKGLASILTGTGLLIISTPNGKDDQNPYHHHGWNADEFSGLLSADFREIKLYGQGVSQEIKGYRAEQQQVLEQTELRAESIKNKYPFSKFVPQRLRKSIYAWLVERKLPREKQWGTEDFPIVEGMKDGEIIIAVCRKK